MATTIRADKTRPTNPPPTNPPPAGPKTEPPPAGPKKANGRAVDDPARLAQAARIFRQALARAEHAASAA